MTRNFTKAVEILFEARKKKPIIDVLKILGENIENEKKSNIIQGLDAPCLKRIANIFAGDNDLTEFEIALIIKAVSNFEPENAAFWLRLITAPFNETTMVWPIDPSGEIARKTYTSINGIALGVFETAGLDEYPNYSLDENIALAIKRMIFAQEIVARYYDIIYNQLRLQKSPSLKKFQGQMCNLIKAFGKKLKDNENDTRLRKIRPLISDLAEGMKETKGQQLSTLGILILDQINYVILNLLETREINKILADHVLSNR